MNEEIKNAIENFINFIKLGWASDLAFQVVYDSVYDLIGEEDFLNMCQNATLEQSK